MRSTSASSPPSPAVPRWLPAGRSARRVHPAGPRSSDPGRSPGEVRRSVPSIRPEVEVDRTQCELPWVVAGLERALKAIKRLDLMAAGGRRSRRGAHAYAADRDRTDLNRRVTTQDQPADRGADRGNARASATIMAKRRGGLMASIPSIPWVSVPSGPARVWPGRSQQ